MDFYLTKKVKLVGVLEYKDLFPEQKELDIEKILVLYNREQLIRAASLLGFYYRNSKFPDVNRTHRFFSNPYSDYVEDIKKRWFAYCSLHSFSINHSIHFVLSRTALELLRIIISIEPQKFKNIVNPDKTEYDLFRVIIAINQKIMECKFNPDDDYNTMIYLNQYTTNALNDLNDDTVVTGQIACSLKIFEALSSIDRFQTLYNSFLKKWNIKHWRQYTNSILGVYMMLSKERKNPKPGVNLINFDILPQWEKVINSNVLDLLSITYNDVCDENTDYKLFRSHPLIKFNNAYLPINLRLIAECIYSGVYFSLKDLCENPDLGISKFDKFYKEDLFEHFVFQRTLWECIKRFDVAYPTKEMVMSDDNINEEQNQPDFYIRKGNKTAIFECKAIKLNAVLRDNADAKQLMETLRKKLYNKYYGSNKSKWVGVPQIMRFIDYSTNHKYNWDQPNKSVTYYPILVLEDANIVKASFNSIMHHWQNEYLNINKIDSKIKPIIIISMDTLILYSKAFVEKGFFYYFDKFLSKYYVKMSNNEKAFKIEADFNDFMRQESKHSFDFSKFIKE